MDDIEHIEWGVGMALAVGDPEPLPIEEAVELVHEVRRLRARVAELESATEWGAKWSVGGYCPAKPARDEEWVRRHARMWGTKPIRRHVGPWVYADTGEAVTW
jgi:hypothetical protein